MQDGKNYKIEEGREKQRVAAAGRRSREGRQIDTIER